LVISSLKVNFPHKDLLRSYGYHCLFLLLDCF